GDLHRFPRWSSAHSRLLSLPVSTPLLSRHTPSPGHRDAPQRLLPLRSPCCMTLPSVHGQVWLLSLNVRARLTAIHIDTGTRHQGGALRGQECYHGRDFFGFAKAS